MRYYEQKFPKVDEYVIVKIDTLTEMGAYVSLLEYNNIEGLIQQTELSRRKVKSETKMARIGKTEVCVVLHVDKTKGFIDLSKRRVNTEEIVKVEDRYNKAKTVQSILLHVSEMTDVDLEILCKNISWPLYQKFGHAYNAFKFSLTDPEKAFEGILFDTEDIKKCLLQTIKNRMQDKPVKIRADLEITCFGYEGIEGIKNSIKEGELLSDKEVSFKISLIAPPLYVILGHTTDPNFGIEVLTKCIDVMKKKISEYDGKVVIKANPRAVTAREDHSLNLLLEQLREEKESSGESEDESSEEEEYIGM